VTPRIFMLSDNKTEQPATSIARKSLQNFHCGYCKLNDRCRHKISAINFNYGI